MTSRQSGWHRPGDAQAALLLAGAPSSCVAMGRSFPWEGWGGPL